MTAKVDPNTGRFTQYRAAVKISFGVEHQMSAILKVGLGKM